MTRVLKKTKTKTGGWTDFHQIILETGYAHLGRPAEFIGDNADENIFKAWLALRDKIMSEWKNPGRRPWAWWIFESPEPRKCPTCFAEVGQIETDQLRAMGELSEEELAFFERVGNAKS